MADIVVQYVTDCPNLQVALDNLDAAGVSVTDVQLVEISEGTEVMPEGFAGSPTVLIRGVNPVVGAETMVSASCTLRVPTVSEIRTAIL